MASNVKRVSKGVPTGGQFKADHKQAVIDAMPDSTDDERLAKAYAEYQALKRRTAHPAGHFDENGIFYHREILPCCVAVCPPTPSEPYEYSKHARSAEHIAEKYHVNEADLLFYKPKGR